MAPMLVRNVLPVRTQRMRGNSRVDLYYEWKLLLSHMQGLTVMLSAVHASMIVLLSLSFTHAMHDL